MFPSGLKLQISNRTVVNSQPHHPHCGTSKSISHLDFCRSLTTGLGHPHQLPLRSVPQAAASIPRHKVMGSTCQASLLLRSGPCSPPCSIPFPNTAPHSVCMGRTLPAHVTLPSSVRPQLRCASLKLTSCHTPLKHRTCHFLG